LREGKARMPDKENSSLFFSERGKREKKAAKALVGEGRGVSRPFAVAPKGRRTDLHRFLNDEKEGRKKRRRIPDLAIKEKEKKEKEFAFLNCSGEGGKRGIFPIERR